MLRRGGRRRNRQCRLPSPDPTAPECIKRSFPLLTLEEIYGSIYILSSPWGTDWRLSGKGWDGTGVHANEL